MFLIHDVFTDLWRCDNELYNGIRCLLGIGVFPRADLGLLVGGANCMPCHHCHGSLGIFQEGVPHMGGWHCIAFISFLSWSCCCPRLCSWVGVRKQRKVSVWADSFIHLFISVRWVGFTVKSEFVTV